MTFLTTSKNEAKAEAAHRKSWNANAHYEVRKCPVTGAYGLWVTYDTCNYAHWAREV